MVDLQQFIHKGIIGNPTIGHTPQGGLPLGALGCITPFIFLQEITTFTLACKIAATVPLDNAHKD